MEVWTHLRNLRIFYCFLCVFGQINCICLEVWTHEIGSWTSNPVWTMSKIWPVLDFDGFHVNICVKSNGVNFLDEDQECLMFMVRFHSKLRKCTLKYILLAAIKMHNLLQHCNSNSQVGATIPALAPQWWRHDATIVALRNYWKSNFVKKNWFWQKVSKFWKTAFFYLICPNIKMILWLRLGLQPLRLKPKTFYYFFHDTTILVLSTGIVVTKKFYNFFKGLKIIEFAIQSLKKKISLFFMIYSND